MVTQLQIFAADVRIYEWGNATNKIQMSISLIDGTNEVEAGGPVKLFIQLKNSSTNEEFLGKYSISGGPGQGLSFVIADPSGIDVSPTYPKDYAAMNAIAYFSTPPIQTKGFEYNLDTLCKLGFLKKMDQVGNYKIIAIQKGRVGTNSIPFIVTSNPLKVKIIPKRSN